MPGFRIGLINAHGKFSLNDSPRFYASYTWDISLVNGIFNNARNNESLLLLKSATLPSISFKKIEVEGSVNYKFAGSPIFEDIKITWYDSYGMGKHIETWFDNMILTNGASVPAQNYKRDTVLTKYLVDDGAIDNIGNGIDLEEEKAEYILKGSWPISFKESDLTYVESSIKTIELTLTYDYHIVKYYINKKLKHYAYYSYQP